MIIFKKTHGIYDDEIELISRAVSNHVENRVLIHRRARLSQSVRQSKQEFKRMIHYIPINSVLIEIKSFRKGL